MNRKQRRVWEHFYRRRKLHALPMTLFSAADIDFARQMFPERWTAYRKENK